MHVALDHILRFENFNLQRPAEYAKISKCNGTLLHTRLINFCQQTLNKLPNFAWIFIFVNDFSVKFAFVFVHGSCRFLLNSSVLPSFVTFYRSLLRF